MVTTTRRYQLLYFVLFASFNGILAFRNVYFDEIGLSGVQMGVVGAVIIAAGILAQPVWGVAADRYGRARLAMAVGAVVSAAAALVFPLGRHVPAPFLLVLGASVLFAAFRSPIGPLANAMVLSSGIAYGRIRAFGSIAFGIGILVVGGLTARLGTTLIFYVYAAGMTMFVLLLIGLPGPDATITPDLRRETGRLLRNRTYVLLLLVAALVGGATASGSVFFSVYMRAIEAGDSMTGVAWFVRTLAEAAVYVGAARVGLRYRHQLTLSTVMHAVTFLAYGLTGALAAVFAIQVVHGVALALFGLSSVNMAHRLAPDGLASTSQTVLTAFGLGVGRVLGELVGGRLFDLVGAQELYLYLTVGVVAAFLVSLGLHLPGARGTPE